MIKVFISSPYSKGDMGRNVRVNMDCANELINKGFTPFIPLLFHFQDMVHPQEYDVWLRLTTDWIDSCDFLLRLPGESNGCDKEVKHAIDIGVPVFYSIEELEEYVNS